MSAPHLPEGIRSAQNGESENTLRREVSRSLSMYLCGRLGIFRISSYVDTPIILLARCERSMRQASTPLKKNMSQGTGQARILCDRRRKVSMVNIAGHAMTKATRPNPSDAAMVPGTEAPACANMLEE
ncbi:hypothetical protein AYL99_11636 [Fonsecaea erecta]|uniref:Uncharacterized protein n=1 Tax=Fonsecaea erecta TaxID=1367422 RepID=A0A178Z3J7_9EURO|nr:hypothetical protein AYL99_11636 [Fonsecaea erecta]OAP54101.1 hypothetical protein AYL99_11636 [Fonsecaea erecta]